MTCTLVPERAPWRCTIRLSFAINQTRSFGQPWTPAKYVRAEVRVHLKCTAPSSSSEDEGGRSFFCKMHLWNPRSLHRRPLLCSPPADFLSPLPLLLLMWIQIFRGLTNSFNLVFKSWASCLPPLWVSDISKSKTLPSDGKFLQSPSHDDSLVTATDDHLLLATNTPLLKWNPRRLVVSYFPSPFIDLHPLYLIPLEA